MRRVLAVDTSARRRSVALVCLEDGTPLRAVTHRDRPAGEGLLAAVGEVMEEARALPLAGVVAATGPGSYTGVRAGMAAALGIAHPAGLPLHGVGSLDVAAHGAPPAAGRVVVVAEAGRGALYVAAYVCGTGGVGVDRVEPPRRVGDEWEPPEGWLVVSLDDVVVGGRPVLVVPVEEALAAAVPAALARPPLDPSRLAAEHVAAAGGTGRERSAAGVGRGRPTV